MIRVTRPGGRIVVLDTDWGTTAINGADRALTRRVLEGFVDHITQGWIGQLPGLFHQAGLHHVMVAAETSWSRDRSAATDRPCPQLAAGAIDQGAITAEEAGDWLDQLAGAAEEGTFLWATTGFAVAATTPDSSSCHS
jgi:hypothetical protein